MFFFSLLSRIKTINSIILFTCLFLPASPAILFAADKDDVSDGRVLVISKVSSNPKKYYKRLKPIADYVVSKMGDLGYSHARVLIAKDNSELIRYLQQGKVDWVTGTSFSTMIAHEKAGAELLLRRWKKGVAEYHSVFFVRSDSGIQTLDDFKGKTIVFQNRHSTSSFYIPADILIRHGLNLVQLDSPWDTPPKDTVGFVFAGKEITMSAWVYKGIVDIGAFSNLDFSKNSGTPALFREEFTILHRSKSFPRALELVRKDLPETIKQRIKEILLHAHEDSAAVSALQAYQKTKKFDELDDASILTLQDCSSITKRVKETLAQ